MSYCAAAEQVAGWLVSTAERGPQGWRWPLQPGVAPDVEHGLGWGTAGPVLFFVEVSEDKIVKNRLHLDLQADDELEREVERLEALGAHIRNWAEEDGGIWCVMLDPEGNEFCVMPRDDAVA